MARNLPTYTTVVKRNPATITVNVTVELLDCRAEVRLGEAPSALAGLRCERRDEVIDILEVERLGGVGNGPQLQRLGGH